MNVSKIGAEIAAVTRLMKAASLYAESLKQYPIATEYKNIFHSITKDYHKLAHKISFMNPAGKSIITDDLEDDRIHYISEVVLLMNVLPTEDCKEILESLKKNVD